jgi:type II secretion system protein D
MTIKTAKCPAILWIVPALCCCLTLPLSAQTRGTGGGGGGYGGGGGGTGGGGGGGYGGGGGGSSRSSGSSASSSSSTVDRPPNGQVGSANFYVDPDTHTVFLTADETTAGYVSNVMANLDKPKPQVLIKVVFLQVTYNNGYDVGIEGGITKNINASTTASASNLFGLAASQAGVFGGTGSTSLNSLPGAGLYTIAGNDFSATLRAIQEVGKVEILSRPTIMTRNNQQATVVVGQQVPIISGVTYDTFGNEHSSVTYQNVGVILQVTPYITTDNMVEMILAPQISSVAPNQATVISSGTNGSFSTPYINIESANTVVVTPNGQTVAIGGMMQDNKTTTDSKIPLLGDIPGLGVIFHHKTSQVTKTELMIFLTPYVIRSPEDLVRMTIDERSRMDEAPKAFPARELNQYLSPQPSPPNTAPAAGFPHRR